MKFVHVRKYERIPANAVKRSLGGWEWPNPRGGTLFIPRDGFDGYYETLGRLYPYDIEELHVVEAPDGTRAYSAYPDNGEKVIE